MSEALKQHTDWAARVVAEATEPGTAAREAGKDFAFTIEADLPVLTVTLEPGEEPPPGRDWRVYRFSQRSP